MEGSIYDAFTAGWEAAEVKSSNHNHTKGGIAPRRSAMMEREFGTDPKHLARRDSPDTSQEAAESIDTTQLERMVCEAIARFPNGCISDEVRALFPHYPYSSITARYRALLDKGFIEDTGERRKGASGKNQRVMKFVPNT